MPKKKKKRFFKKAKVKISTPQLVMLTAIIASLSILMLFFSILFPGKKTSVASKNAESVPNAVEKQVPSETVSSVAVENKTGRNQVMPENKGKPVPAKTVKPSESENTAASKKTAPEKSENAQKVPSIAKKTSGSQLPLEKKHPSPSAAVQKNVNSSESQKNPPAVQKTDRKTSQPENSQKVGKKSSVYQLVPQSVNNALLVFVFDDGGQNIFQLKKYLELPFPVTVAVLPGLAHSEESASLVRNSRHELFLHQPMQAKNLSVNPGPGAILPQMTFQQIRQIIAENIRQIGPVAGFNNHEGSLILENPVLVEAFLEEAAAQKIYFLDSKTSAASVAKSVALEMGISIYSRDIFLDNIKTRENVVSELLKGLEIANKKGQCIMIGHVWSADLIPAILTEFYPVLFEKGYRFSVVSQAKFD